MPSSADSVALAIRAGVIPMLYKSNSSNSADHLSESVMVQTAQEHLAMYAKTGAATEASNLISSNSAIIEAAVKGIVIAYKVISGQLATMRDQRKRFEEEFQVGMASFTIPGHLESKDLSEEEKVVAGFFNKLEQHPLLFAYSGVKLVRNEDDPRTKRYCALPLYAMNQLKHPIASPRALDEARIAINLLFHSKAIQVMQNMADDFEMDSEFLDFFRSRYQGDNYLNARRAPRVILTVLFNILWSIQHPIDCETGFSLTVSESFKICEQFNTLLNQYLDDRVVPGPLQINSDKNNLIRMIKHVELRCHSLQVGFLLEKLRQFNLKDLTNSAHRVLRGLDTSLFKFLFNKIDVKTKTQYPDKLAAADIVDTISVLNALLNKNPVFLLKFDLERRKIPNSFLAKTYINPQVKTVIDIFIVFCHLTRSQRKQLVVSLRQCPEAGEDGDFIAWELKKFSKHYIEPIEQINIELLNETSNSLLLKKLPKLTASRLIPLLTLAIADFRTAVDLNCMDKIAEPEDSLFSSGKDQVQQINDAAQANSLPPPQLKLGDYDYHWRLSPYLSKLTPTAALAVDSLPSKQYKMTQITELLDCISELTQNYRSFLQFKSFQAFLMECLQYVDDAYQQFAEETQLIEQYLSFDGLLDRTSKDVVMEMVHALLDNLSIFRQSLDEITHIVAAPDFTELRKHELTKQVDRIEKKFIQLFNKEPTNFIRTYQRILSQVDMAPIRAEKIEKTKKRYEFSKQYFIKIQQTLIEHRPNLPIDPHFLSQLKKSKLEKYLKLIGLSIQHIDNLVLADNFSLDTYEFFRQLELINGETSERKEEDVKQSSYCKVILRELKNQFSQHVVKQPVAVPVHSRAARVSRPSLTESALLPPFHTVDPAPSPSPIKTPSSQEETEEQKMVRMFDILKKELQKVLEDYIQEKIQERPRHWFYKILQVFKGILGQLLTCMKERLLETKIQVAQKVVDTLKKSPSGNANITHVDLTLTSSEMNTLSRGALGRRTLFFRDRVFGENQQIKAEPTRVLVV